MKTIKGKGSTFLLCLWVPMKYKQKEVLEFHVFQNDI